MADAENAAPMAVDEPQEKRALTPEKPSAKATPVKEGAAVPAAGAAASPAPAEAKPSTPKAKLAATPERKEKKENAKKEKRPAPDTEQKGTKRKGLYDSSPVVEGKRERKQVERLEVVAPVKTVEPTVKEVCSCVALAVVGRSMASLRFEGGADSVLRLCSPSCRRKTSPQPS